MKCPYDLPSPFTKINILKSLLQDQEVMEEGELRSLNYDKDGYNIIVEIKMVNESIEIIKETLYEKGVNVGSYYNYGNGYIQKEIGTDWTGKFSITKISNNLFILHSYTDHGISQEHNYICSTYQNGDKTITFKYSRNNLVKTSVLQRDGSWFHAESKSDDRDRKIIMVIHNYEHHFNRPEEYLNVMGDMYIYGTELEEESGVFTEDEALFYVNEVVLAHPGGYIGNDVKIHFKLIPGIIITKIYKNYGIILLSDAILVNSYHTCEENPSLNDWLEYNFDNITHNETLLKSDNTGFLVYTTPEGETYRTLDNEIIAKFVNDEDYEWFDNCGMITYYTDRTENGSLTLKKNYGIIVDGKLVRESNNLMDHGTAMEYADETISIKWNKLQVQI